MVQIGSSSLGKQNTQMKKTTISRRLFFMGSIGTLTGCATPRRKSLTQLGYKSPNEKLNIAGIGVGGKGASDLKRCESENIVALCDVDWKRGAETFQRYPNAKKYKNFLEMLDKENIDACTISTADHLHAFAAMRCMERGIHVYVQKPLTHSIWESRQLMFAARKYNVTTQMGNQGHSSNKLREFCEVLWAGTIGDVREVHCWTDRPIWPQGIAKPLPEEEIPDHIDWDLWLGPAPWRPFNSNYMPFKWRGWWDFGTGALGDMGCHIMDAPYWALRLGDPISVECLTQDGKNDQTYPNKSIIRYKFPERGSMPAVMLYWYDGGYKPPFPKEVQNDPLVNFHSGNLFIGEKGCIISKEYADDFQVYPKDYEKPDAVIPRSMGHYKDWIQACKGGIPACSNFDYSGPYTEIVLLGNLALRTEGELLWDGPNMRVTNNREANRYIKRKPRRGWEL